MKLALALAFVLLSPATARDNGQWGGQPADVRQWFQSLMQPDDPYSSCCGEADAFEADQFEVQDDHYVAIITNGKGEIPNGTRIRPAMGSSSSTLVARSIATSFQEAFET